MLYVLKWLFTLYEILASFNGGSGSKCKSGLWPFYPLENEEQFRLLVVWKTPWVLWRKYMLYEYLYPTTICDKISVFLKLFQGTFLLPNLVFRTRLIGLALIIADRTCMFIPVLFRYLRRRLNACNFYSFLHDTEDEIMHITWLDKRQFLRKNLLNSDPKSRSHPASWFLRF